MTIAHKPLASENAHGSLRAVRAALTLLVAIGLMAAALFLPVVQNSGQTTTGYAIQKDEQELSALNARTYSLQAQIAGLGAMTRIRAEAARLGMVPASGQSISVLVEEPAPQEVLLPRGYQPVPLATAAPASGHGLLWSFLHLVSIR